VKNQPRSGRTLRAACADLPVKVMIEGPWNVRELVEYGHSEHVRIGWKADI